MQLVRFSRFGFDLGFSAHQAGRTLCGAALSCVMALSVTLSLTAAASAQGPRSVSKLVKQLAPAVVNISTSQSIKGARGRPLPSVPKGSPFEELFEDFFDKKNGVGPRRKVASLGSGFVIDGNEGLVVTNNHVIDGADEIEIIFADGKRLKVEKVLGVDKKTDLALLKVSSEKPLPSVKFGSSDRAEVGDWVLAIGNPFGLGGSVSIGIISAKQRDIKTGPYDDYLQTDAAINKGNSGGPLFNMDGEVIGVNTAIISPTGGSIGIGFAVPADVARVVIDQLRRYGETRRGWLGVRVQSIGEDLAKSLKVAANRGAFVAGVTNGGPAEKGGIKPGDIIISFDGKLIPRMRTLLRIVAQTDVGRTAPVEIIRNGQRMTIDVVVGRLVDPKEKRVESKAGDPKKASRFAQGPVEGMTLSAMTPELATRFKLQKDAKGLIVTNVAPGSLAAQRGVVAGDRIVLVGSTAVNTRAEFAAAIAKLQQDGKKRVRIVLEVTGGRRSFLALKID